MKLHDTATPQPSERQDEEFWKRLKNIAINASNAAQKCEPNSPSYWEFCKIIGQVITLMGDARWDSISSR